MHLHYRYHFSCSTFILEALELTVLGWGGLLECSPAIVQPQKQVAQPASQRQGVVYQSRVQVLGLASVPVKLLGSALSSSLTIAPSPFNFISRGICTVEYQQTTLLAFKFPFLLWHIKISFLLIYLFAFIFFLFS